MSKLLSLESLKHSLLEQIKETNISHHSKYPLARLAATSLSCDQTVPCQLESLFSESHGSSLGSWIVTVRKTKNKTKIFPFFFPSSFQPCLPTLKPYYGNV